MDQDTLNKIADALELIVSALRGDGVRGQGRCDAWEASAAMWDGVK